MNMKHFFLVILMVAALTGCATTSATDMVGNIKFNPDITNIPTQNTADYAGRDVAEISDNLLIEQRDATGIRETASLLRGDAKCFRVPFPKELRKEQPVPERIKWYALGSDGKYEYLAQLLKRSPDENDAELVTDDTVENVKVIVFSTRAEKIFGLSSPDDPGVEIKMEKFINDPSYRQSLVEKYGTPLSNFEKVDYLVDIINTWNRFETPRGYILTPLSEEKFREINGINPAYSHSQKLNKYGKWSISTDPVGMILSNIVMNNAKAAFAPTSGWDFKSKPTTP